MEDYDKHPDFADAKMVPVPGGEKPQKITQQDVSLKAVELIWGNPVIPGILAITVIAVVTTGAACIITKEVLSGAREIIIPALTGISGLASGVAIGKLSKK